MKALWKLLLAVALAWVGPGAVHADGSAAKSAAALGSKYGSLHDRLGHNQFQRPLYMESSEASGAVTGDIYALIDHPFVTAGAALNGPARWCAISNGQHSVLR